LPKTKGNQADRFIRSHLHQEQRRGEWDASVTFRGQNLTLTEVLIRLRSERLKSAAIAKELNTLRNLDSTHPNVFTESAVSKKLVRLGLTEKSTLGTADLVFPDFGLVKAQGELQYPEAALYIYANLSRSTAALSESLSVTENGLLSFISRHHITADRGYAPRTSIPSLASPISLHDKYALQHTIIEKSTEWVLKEGRVPTSKHFKLTNERLPFSKHTVFANMNSKNKKRSAFRDVKEFTQVLMSELVARKIPFKMTSIEGLGDGPLQNLAKQNFFNLMEAWVKNKGSAMKVSDLERITGISASRLFAGPNSQGTTIFTSRYSLFSEAKAALKERGVNFLLVEVDFRGEVPDDLRSITQTEALEYLTERYEQNGIIRFFPSKISKKDHPFDYARLTASGGYKEPERYKARIFDSLSHFLTAMEQYALARGLVFSVGKE
jgi:hypothetical protein